MPISNKWTIFKLLTQSKKKRFKQSIRFECIQMKNRFLFSQLLVKQKLGEFNGNFSGEINAHVRLTFEHGIGFLDNGNLYMQFHFIFLIQFISSFAYYFLSTSTFFKKSFLKLFINLLIELFLNCLIFKLNCAQLRCVNVWQGKNRAVSSIISMNFNMFFFSSQNFRNVFLVFKIEPKIRQSANRIVEDKTGTK